MIRGFVEDKNPNVNLKYPENLKKLLWEMRENLVVLSGKMNELANIYRVNEDDYKASEGEEHAAKIINFAVYEIERLINPMMESCDEIDDLRDTFTRNIDNYDFNGFPEDEDDDAIDIE